VIERRPPEGPEQQDEASPPSDGPPEIGDAASQETEYPADETDEG
jgi:hypothetical protein